LFFLFVRIKIAIVFKKIFANLVIKVYNLIVSITLNNLKSNKDNFNIRSCNYKDKKEVFLKKF